jgi:porphobilinogen synthase
MSKPSAAQPGFPATRLRRLRQNPRLRDMVRATHVDPRHLIQPLFIRPGRGVRQEIGAMPGVYQLSVDELAREAERIAAAGVAGVILFGIPAEKDPLGQDAYSDSGVVQQGVKAVKQAAAELLVVTDVCFCEYTDHGHCGVVNQATGRTDVDSGMMDGMVAAIRRALDESGFTHLPIMSYAAKYSSAFYGPFRDAAESAPAFGDRRSYQMDPASDPGQALREVELDLAEGADIIMVKPALVYLDILRSVHDQFPGVPLAAYNVSGEYSMVKAAAARGWFDERSIVLESLTAMHRAGADVILTYWATQVARWLKAE